MHKFLLIFQTFVQTINSNEQQEETDGPMTNVIPQIVNTIIQLLKNNIDSLNIPAVLKGALKKLQSLFKMARTQMRSKRPARPVGRGEKNNDRIRVRNRRYKIKRYLAQPKNIHVKHNGRVVKRMIIRRQTIYPSTRRRREY